MLYGEPRLTKDIDITIGLNIDALDKIVTIMGEISLQPLPKALQQFVRQTMVLPLVDSQSNIRVDIIFSFSPFEQDAIQRANPVVLDHTTIKFVSLEDLIVFKMFSGRPRDLEDVSTILIKNPNADTEFIKRQLETLSYEEKDFAKAFARVLNSI